MTISLKQKLVILGLAVLLVVLSVLPTPIMQVAYAYDTTPTYDQTDVLDDLQFSTVNGEPFDIKDFPFDESKSLQVISFVEYCYSYKTNMRDNYGLYIYVYNPQGINISQNSKSNKVQMAVSYDAAGLPNDYAKFDLECLSVSTGNYNRLFYKFKVVDKKVNGTTFVDRVNSNERRYDVSGIELLTYGQHNATEYGIGGTYKFTGFAEGYGPDASAKSTLNCVAENLETLTLEVHHTNYRTNVSSLGKYHYNEVNTVYFSVPKRVFQQYGNLQKIHAEWWEYKTKMATITSNENFYNQLIKYIGVDVKENGSVPIELYCDYSSTGGGAIGSAIINNYGWTYNVNLDTQYTALGSVFSISNSKDVQTIMPYVFYSPVVDVDRVFSFLYSDPIAGNVEGTVVQDWIYNYKNDLGHGYIDCNGRQISKDLFEDYVDEGRTMGYNNVNIDLADTFDLNSYDSNHSWWDKLWDYGFSWPSTDGDYKDVKPIYELKASDLVGTNKDISNALLVNEDDVTTLQTYYAAETLKGNRVVLFRFANTDYYTAPAFRSGFSGNIQNTDTYVARQTVFFDFDIIDLTFNKDGVYRVIPVVSSPTDIVNGFTAPPQELEWWKILLAVVLIILLLIVLAPVLPYILKAIVWIIMLPFKAVKAIVESIKKKKKKDTGGANENG